MVEGFLECWRTAWVGEPIAIGLRLAEVDSPRTIVVLMARVDKPAAGDVVEGQCSGPLKRLMISAIRSSACGVNWSCWNLRRVILGCFAMA